MIDEDLRREKSQTGPEAAEALRAATEHFAVLHARLNGLRAPGDHDAISGCLFQYLDAAGEMLHAGLHPARCLRQSLIGLLNSPLPESGPAQAPGNSPGDPPAADEGNVFRSDGGDWYVRYGGKQARFGHAAGLFYIAYILGHPGKALSATELKITSQPKKLGRADEAYGSMGNEALGFEGLAVSTSQRKQYIFNGYSN